MALLVGLGNPGSTYASTRHNIGFMVIDALLSKYSNQNISKNSFKGDLFKTSKHLLLKPTTYMNLSGESVVAVKHFYKVEDIIVIHDDLDLPFGAIRFKFGGGHGGHNGLKSVDKMLGTREYLRIRMGIGKPEFGTVSDFVLGKFNEQESAYMDTWIEKTCEAIDAMDDMSWENVASQYSQKKMVVT